MKPEREIRADVLIVGGGPAGIAAAAAISDLDGPSVIVADENPALGGQIWKRELGRLSSPVAADLLRSLEIERIRVFPGTQIIADAGNNYAAGTGDKGKVLFGFKKLIIATGARERFLPFPNWTLPGVFGAGGLQALEKGGLRVSGKRIVVAGTGPLLLAVADHLRSKGARVIQIVEQALSSRLIRLGSISIMYPDKLRQAAALGWRLRGIPFQTGAFTASAEGVEKLEAVNIVKGENVERVECEMLACGFHLVPNTELAEMFGCPVTDGYVNVDEYQETAVPGIYCAGEPTGIGGVELSLIEGTVAGLAAAGEQTSARKHFRHRSKYRKFAEALNHAFELRDGLRSLPDDETFICRCEDVTMGQIRHYSSFREAKLQERCGMGFCQGRVCAPAAEFLFGWEQNVARPPLYPARLGDLAE